MSIIQILFLIAIVGHLLCGCCDCLLTYVPGGKKFGATQLKDNVLMTETFEKMPLKTPLLSMLLGCLALFMCYSKMGMHIQYRAAVSCHISISYWWYRKLVRSSNVYWTFDIAMIEKVWEFMKIGLAQMSMES